MTQQKKHTLLWFSAGLLCILMAMLTVFTGLSGKALVTDPEGIPEAADTVMNCIRTGDWETLKDFVSGTPAFHPVIGDPQTPEKLIWDAYQNSLQWCIRENFEISENHITQRVTVTCLDIPATARTMAKILDNAGTSAEDPRILYTAAEQVLDADLPMTQQELTLTLLRENGQWRVLPDAAFQSLLSGLIIH